MNRPQAVGMIILGVAAILAALLIDVVGIGTEGFGVLQIVGLVIGIILIGAGISFYRRLRTLM